VSGRKISGGEGGESMILGEPKARAAAGVHFF